MCSFVSPVTEVGLVQSTSVPLTEISKSSTVAVPPLSEVIVFTIVKLVSLSVLVTEQATVSPKATVIPSLILVSAAPAQLNVPLV